VAFLNFYICLKLIEYTTPDFMSDRDIIAPLLMLPMIIYIVKKKIEEFPLDC